MKKVFFISALTLIMVGIMIGCKKKDDVNNGCTCKFYDSGYGRNETWNSDKEGHIFRNGEYIGMQWIELSSCSAFAEFLLESGEGYYENLSCK